MKRQISPIKEIIKDLTKLATLANEGATHAPDFHQEMIKKQTAKILSKYVVTRRRINKIIKTVTA